MNMLAKIGSNEKRKLVYNPLKVKYKISLSYHKFTWINQKFKYLTKKPSLCLSKY